MELDFAFANRDCKDLKVPREDISHAAQLETLGNQSRKLYQAQLASNHKLSSRLSNSKYVSALGCVCEAKQGELQKGRSWSRQEAFLETTACFYVIPVNFHPIHPQHHHNTITTLYSQDTRSPGTLRLRAGSYTSRSLKGCPTHPISGPRRNQIRSHKQLKLKR